MRLTNSARQEAGLFQNIQTVPLCWNGAESLLAVAAASRGHLTASPAMVTGAVARGQAVGTTSRKRVTQRKMQGAR
jgi:hypothetical protein